LGSPKILEPLISLKPRHLEDGTVFQPSRSTNRNGRRTLSSCRLPIGSMSCSSAASRLSAARRSCHHSRLRRWRIAARASCRTPPWCFVSRSPQRADGGWQGRVFMFWKYSREQRFSVGRNVEETEQGMRFKAPPTHSLISHHPRDSCHKSRVAAGAMGGRAGRGEGKGKGSMGNNQSLRLHVRRHDECRLAGEYIGRHTHMK